MISKFLTLITICWAAPEIFNIANILTILLVLSELAKPNFITKFVSFKDPNKLIYISIVLNTYLIRTNKKYVFVTAKTSSLIFHLFSLNPNR